MNYKTSIQLVLTGILLLSAIGSVSLWQDKPISPPTIPDASAAHSSSRSVSEQGFSDSMPPAVLSSLPFVSEDNTCYSGTREDLSAFTGLLSGGESREYRIPVAGDNRTLFIAAEPSDSHYDISFALFDSENRCLIAVDAKTEGFTEQTEIAHLAAGTYRLVVGGYRDHCGPYLLTVRERQVPPAEITKTVVEPGANGVRIHWTSFAEVGLSHYCLYRISDEGRVRIAALRAHGSPADFAEYKFLDRTGRQDAVYELETVARDGRIEVWNVVTG